MTRTASWAYLGKPVAGVAGSRSGQGRKLDAAAKRVDAFSADADAVAEFPDIFGAARAGRAAVAAAGLFLLACIARTASGAAAAADDGVIAFAVEHLLAG